MRSEIRTDERAELGQSTFCINSVAHHLGESPFDDRKSARDHFFSGKPPTAHPAYRPGSSYTLTACLPSTAHDGRGVP